MGDDAGEVLDESVREVVIAEAAGARPSGKGLVLTCSWCRRTQRLDIGNVYPDRQAAEMMLALMTGGRDGMPGVIREAGPLEPGLVGRSSCCETQIEGELYGYEDDPPTDKAGE